jgi:hypothetical protein
MEQLRALVRSQAQFPGKSLDNIPNADFAIQRRQQNGEH